jgi:hypothetical protein
MAEFILLSCLFERDGYRHIFILNIFEWINYLRINKQSKVNDNSLGIRH